MNLSKLFELQKALDAPYSDVPDRLSKDILWLTEELGELVREWRGHKYRRYEEYQQPNTSQYVLKKEYKHLHITQTGAYEYQLRDEFGKVVFDDVTDHHHDHINPLLEEYTDCLSIILSIGLQIDYPTDEEYEFYGGDTLKEFLVILEAVGHLSMSVRTKVRFGHILGNYSNLIRDFIDQGDALGFTWDQIESSYISKVESNKLRNEVQHEQRHTTLPPFTHKENVTQRIQGRTKHIAHPSLRASRETL